jgi:hypothetical protein
LAGPLRPGEHPCEAAWRLTAAYFASEDACSSFYRLDQDRARELGCAEDHVFVTSPEAGFEARDQTRLP